MLVVFSGTVCPEQSEDPAGRDGERGAVEREDVTESLRDGIDDEGHPSVLPSCTDGSRAPFPAA